MLWRYPEYVEMYQFHCSNTVCNSSQQLTTNSTTSNMSTVLRLPIVKRYDGIHLYRSKKKI